MHSLVASLLLLAASLVWIGFQVNAYRGMQMDLDEALHATRGLDIASALRRGSLSDLMYETVRPHWYPPAHGYLLGAWFLLVGASVTTARLYSSVCYFLLGLLLWACARQAFPRIHPIFLLTPILFLLSDNQHMLLASMSMRDLPANLLAFISVYFFTKSIEREGIENTLLTAWFALLSFFTRYSQGMIIFGALAISYMLYFKQFRGRILRTFATWLPSLLILFGWLVILGHWRWVVAYANIQPGEGEAWSLDSLKFYFQQLTGESSGWLPISVIALWGITWIRNRTIPSPVIPYLVFFGMTLIVLIYRSDHIARFGVTLFPPLWILATGSVSELVEQIHKRGFRLFPIAMWVFLLAFLSIKNLVSLPAGLSTIYENTNTGVNAAYNFIADTIQVRQQEQIDIVMYGETDSWNSHALHFYLQSLCMRSNPRCLIPVIGERELNKGWPPQNTTKDARVARVKKALGEADYVVIFAKMPVSRAGWFEISRRAFTFERHKLDPKKLQAVVLSRAPSTP